MRIVSWLLVALALSACGGGNTSSPAGSGGTGNNRDARGQPQDQPAPDEIKDLKQVMSATVFITARYRPCDKTAEEMSVHEDQLVPACGSGFVVDPGGLVITNRHVVEAWHMETVRSARTGLPEARALYHLHDVTVRIDSGTNKTRVYFAKVLAARELPDDVALLRIEPESDLPCLKLGASEGLAMQQPVWAVGFPLGGNMEEYLQQIKLGKNPYGPDVSVREGRVTSLRKDDQGAVKAVENSCNIQPGNSGGPVVDSSGHVVGLTTYLIRGTDPVGSESPMALPTERIQHHFGAYLDKLRVAREMHGAPKVFRVLKNPDPGKRGVTEFGGPELMFHRANDGDIIEFGEGEWVVDEELWWNKAITVRIRGKGRDKTQLTLRKPIHIAPAAGHWLEISNLELAGLRVEGDYEASYLHDYLAEVRGGGQTYLTGLRVYHPHAAGPCDGTTGSNYPQINPSGRCALLLDAAANTEVNQCELEHCLITGKTGTPRISSTNFKWSDMACYAASPVVSGCRVSSIVCGYPWGKDSAMFGGSPTLSGVYFMEKITSLGLMRTSATVDSCRVAGSVRLVAPADEGPVCSVKVNSCAFDDGGLQSLFGVYAACDIEGRVNATFTDCNFHRNDLCIRAHAHSSLSLNANYFLRTGLSPGVAVIPESGETRDDAVRRLAAASATGLVIHDGAYVKYSGNHFDSRIGGIAVLLRGEAPDLGSEDNLCTGYTSFKERSQR